MALTHLPSLDARNTRGTISIGPQSDELRIMMTAAVTDRAIATEWGLQPETASADVHNVRRSNSRIAGLCMYLFLTTPIV